MHICKLKYYRRPIEPRAHAFLRGFLSMAGILRLGTPYALRVHRASLLRPVPPPGSRDAFFIASSCIVVRSIEEALLTAHKLQAGEVFIIGGGQIYAQTIDLWERLYLTLVDCPCTGDVFFPEINFDEWTCSFDEAGVKDDKNPYDHRFLIYDRK